MLHIIVGLVLLIAIIVCFIASCVYDKEACDPAKSCMTCKYRQGFTFEKCEPCCNDDDRPNWEPVEGDS